LRFHNQEEADTVTKEIVSINSAPTGGHFMFGKRIDVKRAKEDNNSGWVPEAEWKAKVSSW
jgi:hypothetical protein